MLLYDLTSTYFESDPPFAEGDKRQNGSSRDKRSDCVQVVLALVVTPEGFPLAYEVMAGNTADKKTLRGQTPVPRRVATGEGHGERGRLSNGRPSLAFALRREKPREVRRREGRYLLRSNLPAEEPARLWQFYIQLTQVEAAFKDLKQDVGLRPIHHQLEHRIEAHVLVAFLAYCLHVSLRHQLRAKAPGLTPRAVTEKFAAIQMLDVHFPTTDGRELIFRRYTQP